jgi:hypothetical protein
VIYLANPSTETIRVAMRDGRLGCMTTPGQRNPIPEGAMWACDNGVFGKDYVGDDAWIDWLASREADRDRCLFATAPDVVGDAAATLYRSEPFLPIIREHGYPAALVAQDGLEDELIPWDEFDCLFIGGTTEWKLSDAAADLVNQARSHLKWVHMGRVNSFRRVEYAHYIGCDSVDGTFLVFGPDRNLPQLLGWMRQINSQGVLS